MGEGKRVVLVARQILGSSHREDLRLAISESSDRLQDDFAGEYNLQH
jgi:hypothetical protein